MTAPPVLGGAVVTCCHACGAHIEPDHIATLRQLDLPRRQRLALDTLIGRFGTYVTKDALVDAVYGNDPDGGPVCADEVVQSVVCRLRGHTGGSGFAIENARFQGYRLRREKRG